jgi:hypothetical protein
MPTGNLTTTFLGGSVAIQDLQGRTRTSSVYGLRAGWALNKQWNLNASQLFTPNASNEEGQTITSLSLAYTPQLNTRLALEMARSSGGTGWQISAAHRGKKLSAKALYRHADLGFSSAGNPALSTQRSGYLADVQYKTGPLTLSTASQRYEDGRGGRDYFDRASLQFSKPRLPAVSLYWQQGNQLRRPYEIIGFKDQGESAEEKNLRRKLRPTQSQNMGIQLSHSLGKTNFSLGFDHSESRLLDTPLSAQSADRFSIGLSRPLGSRTSMYFYHSWDANAAAQANADQTGQFTQLLVNHRLSNGIGINMGLQRQEYRSLHVKGSSLISNIGVQVPLGKATSIGVQYRTRLGGSSTPHQSADLLQFRLSRRFNIGRSRGGTRRTIEQRKQLGRIVGRVFDDRNNNGQWDAGEPPVPNVAVALREELQQRSDRIGNYGFIDLTPKIYKVSLVTKTLPIEYSILAPSEVPAPVAADKTTNVDFPAVRTGEIRGIVFLDENRNAVRDSGENVVSNAVVQAEGSEVISFSNERGEFALCNLAPRAWKVSVDTQYIGEDYAMTGESAVGVSVPPGGIVQSVMLGIAPQQREIVSSFAKSE